MFFCNKCAEKNRWPMGWSKSFGRCEVCGERRLCGDVPSKRLPSPDLKVEKGGQA